MLCIGMDAINDIPGGGKKAADQKNRLQFIDGVCRSPSACSVLGVWGITLPSFCFVVRNRSINSLSPTLALTRQDTGYSTGYSTGYRIQDTDDKAARSQAVPPWNNDVNIWSVIIKVTPEEE